MGLRDQGRTRSISNHLAITMDVAFYILRYWHLLGNFPPMPVIYKTAAVAVPAFAAKTPFPVPEPSPTLLEGIGESYGDIFLGRRAMVANNELPSSGDRVTMWVWFHAFAFVPIMSTRSAQRLNSEHITWSYQGSLTESIIYLSPWDKVAWSCNLFLQFEGQSGQKYSAQ